MSAKGNLSAALGAPPPKAIAALPASAQGRLAEMIEAAKTAQRSALDQSIESGLRHVPRLLRPAIRAVVFG